MLPSKVYDPEKREDGKWFFVSEYPGGVKSTHDRDGAGYDSKRGAQNAATRLRNDSSASVRSEDTEIPEFDGKLGWYSNCLGILARRVATCGDKETRNNLKAIATAALAAKQIADQTQMEADIEELKRITEEVQRLSNNVTGA